MLNPTESTVLQTPATRAAAPRPRTVSLILKTALSVAALVLVLVLGLAWGLGSLLANEPLSTSTLENVRRYLWIWGIGSILLAGLAGVLVARWIAAPIRHLSVSLIHQDLEKRPLAIPASGGYAEIEQLSASLARLASTVASREAELADGERKFREAFDLAGIGLVQIDAERKLVIVNRRFCEMLGHERDALLGRRLDEFIHPDDRDVAPHQGGDKAISAIAVASRQRRFIRLVGTFYWAKCSSVTLGGGEGAP